MTKSAVAHSKNSGTLLGEGRWCSSVVKHDVEQRTVHLESAVIVDETKLPEFIHENIDATARRSH